MAKIRVGISGWRYRGWRGGRFYPEDLRQKDELAFASQRLDTIEINGSFYALQRPSSYRAWAEETPANFIFSVKGGRFITHLKRLNDVEIPLANFFASGVLALEEKLGPFLWQLPPMLKFDAEKLNTFLDLLPQDTVAAGKLAGKHNHHLKERAILQTRRKRRLRHAMEIRNESFLCDAFINLLKKHRVALVIADTGGKWPYLEDITGDFVYVRLHGPEELYASGYGDEGLDYWEPRIRIWNSGAEPTGAKRIAGEATALKHGRDVFVYFDNDMKADAPRDAMRLIERLREDPRSKSAG